ncbi:hypothetical protein [Prochlorococcus marinus]|uniref:hypothetical protein n=1 Tax=Prochlorococcus TaxID=1218 RepID=UPI0012DA245E|nr:hypothetical protein [Prochlorococcus marinus]
MSSRHNERRIEVWEKEGKKLHLYTCDAAIQVGFIVFENPNNWKCKGIIKIRTSAFKIDQEYKAKELERKKRETLNDKDSTLGFVFKTKLEAEIEAEELGCKGVHKMGNMWMPCAVRRGVPPVIKTISKPSTVALAEHLTSTDAVLYSTYWCPHCHEQKELFGLKGTAQLQIVECAQDGQNNQHAICERKGIVSFPTWEINGKLVSGGVIPLNKLADLSSYEGPREF